MKKINETLASRAWRLNHLYSIVDKEASRRIFKQNIIQSRISQISSNRKMILKARQFGVSTNGLIEMFDFATHNKNITACVLAHEQDSIKKLFRIITRCYKYIHPKLMPVLDRGGGSKYEIYFPVLNSRIYCDLESRGDTIHWLHVSEAAFIKDPNKLKSTLQAVPIESGIVQIESTPNGMGNLFHDMWNDPEQPYAKLFFPWFAFPDYRIETDDLILTEEEEALITKTRKNFNIALSYSQIAFRRFKQRELGSLFPQEYPEDEQSCFLSSGNSAIDLFKVKDQIDRKKPPIEETAQLKIYKKYDKNRKYVCGVDCAEGVGGDYSVAVIFDAHSREQVACLRGHIKPHQFAQDIFDLCKRYRTEGRLWPLLSVERNNHGHAVILRLEHDPDIKYPNLYLHKDEKIGWLTDKVTRPIMVDAFVEGVENRNVILNDLTTLQECLTLVDEGGKIQAATGKHDDCIMASAIAVQMCIECASLDIYDNIGDKILV